MIGSYKLPPLVRSDFVSMKGWLSDQTVAKLAVVAGFAMTLGVVFWAIYAATLLYFRLIVDYGVFGEAVITYTLHASILLVLVLSVFSTMAALYAGFYTDARLAHWMTLPLAPVDIWRASLVKTVLASAWPLVVVLLPMLMALQTISDGQVWINGVLSLGLLLGLSMSLASLLVVGLVKLLGPVPRSAWLGLGLFFLVLLYGLVRLLFPQAFFRLYLAPDEQAFQAGLSQLPLLSKWLPSWWLATTITTGLSWYSLLPLGLATFCLMWFERLMGSSYLTDRQRIAEQITRADDRTMKTEKLTERHWPITGNRTASLMRIEFLSLGRQGQDLMYAFFIMAMGAVYMVLISYVSSTQPIEARFVPWLTGSLIVGFGFLVTVMMARFVYPLMAKEAKAVWFLFSAPLSRFIIVDAKLLVSLALLLPWLAVGWYGTANMPIAPNQQLMMFWLLVSLGLAILVIQLSLGMIAPNFSEWDKSEQASTSASGLTATVLSLALVFGMNAGWQRFALTGLLDGLYLILGGTGLVGGGLLYLAFKKVERYKKL